MTPRELTTAGILLVLRSRPCHGWEIAEHMRKLGMEVDMSALYRTLRGMEDKGLVGSYWADPVDGPKRRMYDVNGAGLARLDEFTAKIRGQIRMLGMVIAAIDDGS